MFLVWVDWRSVAFVSWQSAEAKAKKETQSPKKAKKIKEEVPEVDKDVEDDDDNEEEDELDMEEYVHRERAPQNIVDIAWNVVGVRLSRDRHLFVYLLIMTSRSFIVTSLVCLSRRYRFDDDDDDMEGDEEDDDEEEEEEEEVPKVQPAGKVIARGQPC